LFYAIDRSIEELAKEWDSVTVETWMQQNCWTSTGRDLINVGNINVFASESREISLLFWLFYVHSAGSIKTLLECNDDGAQSLRVFGGTQQISEKLAEKIGKENTLLKAPVRKVKYDENGVRVESDVGTFKAKTVVIAISPALCGRLQYDPPLPPIRDQLTQRMPLGSVIKTVIIYKNAWWKDRGLSGMLINLLDDPNLPLSTTFDDSDPENRCTALLGFILGDSARSWSSKSQQERRDAVLKQLSIQYQCEESLHPIGYVEKVWQSEEWSRGCYTGVMPPGTMSSFGSALRAPIGRIFWAGTETAET